MKGRKYQTTAISAMLPNPYIPLKHVEQNWNKLVIHLVRGKAFDKTGKTFEELFMDSPAVGLRYGMLTGNQRGYKVG